MSIHIRAMKLPPPEPEYRFCERRWRFDFAWPDRHVALECEGTTYFGKNADGSQRLGRHQTAKGYESDCEKYNRAALDGWTVLRVTKNQIDSGAAIGWLKEALK